MKASTKTIKTKDTIICMIDEYSSGKKEPFDCSITSMNDTHIEVIYLSGHRSRNDSVLYSDVIAKVDLKQPRISVASTFTGNFLEFN